MSTSAGADDATAEGGDGVSEPTYYVKFPCPTHLLVGRFVLECPACNMTNGERFATMTELNARRSELTRVAQTGVDGRWPEQVRAT